MGSLSLPLSIPGLAMTLAAHAGEEIVWRYRVVFAPQGCKRTQDGVVLYYPSTCLAELYEAVAMEKVAAAHGLNASFLQPARTLGIDKYVATVVEQMSQDAKQGGGARVEVSYRVKKSGGFGEWECGHAVCSVGVWSFYDKEGKLMSKRVAEDVGGDGFAFEAARHFIEIGSGGDGAGGRGAAAAAAAAPANGLPAAHEMMYTMDKTQKIKRWRDGVVSVSPGTQLAVFRDSAGKQIYQKVLQGLYEGQELTTAQYLFQIGSKATGVADGQAEAGRERELECLYTRDKLKKQKKWADGRLRVKGSAVELLDENWQVVCRYATGSDSRLL